MSPPQWAVVFPSLNINHESVLTSECANTLVCVVAPFINIYIFHLQTDINSFMVSVFNLTFC